MYGLNHDGYHHDCTAIHCHTKPDTPFKFKVFYLLISYGIPIVVVTAGMDASQRGVSFDGRKSKGGPADSQGVLKASRFYLPLDGLEQRMYDLGILGSHVLGLGDHSQ